MNAPMHTYDFIPADTLFCRDQRPLAAGSSFGRGAHWPLPTVLHSAIRTALLAANGGLPERKSQPGRPHKGQPRQVASTKYQWLNLRGPFPVDENGETYFPIPRDLVADGDEKKAALLRIIPNAGQNNLPKPLTCLAASFARPSKDELPGWVSLTFYNHYYLAAKSNSLDTPPKPDLWDSEHRIGVAIDPETHTAAEGKLYAAEHLRVRDGVRLRFAISEDPHGKQTIDLAGFTLQLGGEQRFGRVIAATDLALPEILITDTLIKWVLLTPAIFVHGWRPGWIGEDGQVKLRVVDKSKRADRRRPRYDDANWRYNEDTDTAEKINAKLVATIVGKPQVVGGWDLLHETKDEDGKAKHGGGKATYLAVPSGSVYYFRADTEEDGARLVGSLQGRCKSDFFGEKGLGLGVCGTWQHQAEPTTGNVPEPATHLKTN